MPLRFGYLSRAALISDVALAGWLLAYALPTRVIFEWFLISSAKPFSRSWLSSQRTAEDDSSARNGRSHGGNQRRRSHSDALRLEHVVGPPREFLVAVVNHNAQ